MAECRYCHTPIEWVLRDGKRVPVHPETQQRHVCTAGRIKINEIVAAFCPKCGFPQQGRVEVIASRDGHILEKKWTII